jgi:uncharacterized protein YxeA
MMNSSFKELGPLIDDLHNSQRPTISHQDKSKSLRVGACTPKASQKFKDKDRTEIRHRLYDFIACVVIAVIVTITISYPFIHQYITDRQREKLESHRRYTITDHHGNEFQNLKLDLRIREYVDDQGTIHKFYGNFHVKQYQVK